MSRRENFNRLVEKLLRQTFNRRDFFLGAEVGVWQGELSAHLLTAFPRLTLYMVDQYKTYAGSRVGGFQPRLDEAKATAKQRTEQFANRRVLVEQSSVDAAATLAGQLKAGLDFAFIDADHRYEAVLADLMAWEPMVRPNGLLFGHDYKQREGFGVIEALFAFTKKRHYLVNVCDARIEGVWWLEKRC